MLPSFTAIPNNAHCVLLGPNYTMSDDFFHLLLGIGFLKNWTIFGQIKAEIYLFIFYFTNVYIVGTHALYSTFNSI